jgi:hypothetical protein
MPRRSNGSRPAETKTIIYTLFLVVSYGFSKILLLDDSEHVWASSRVRHYLPEIMENDKKEYLAKISSLEANDLSLTHTE